MKNKIILLIIALCMIGFGIYSSLVNKPVKKEKTEDTTYKLSKDEVLDNCVNEDDCPTIRKDLYANVTMDTNIKEVQDSLELINNETAKYYEQAKKSKISGVNCTANQSKFKRGMRVNTQYYNYENDKYIQVGVERVVEDLCTETYEFQQVKAYIYSKKDKKIITQDEFKQKENMSDEKLAACLTNSINILKGEGTTAVPSTDYSKYVYYYTSLGQPMISYYDTTANRYRTSLCTE